MESVPPGQAINGISITSDNKTVCAIDKSVFTINRKPGLATITVKAKIGNSTIEDKETYGVTAILPTGARLENKTNMEVYANNVVGARFQATWYIQPSYVSFTGLSLREGSCLSIGTGSLSSDSNIVHPLTTLPGPTQSGNIKKGCLWGTDIAGSPDYKMDIGYGTFLWPIPIEYANDSGQFKPTGIVVNQTFTVDGRGGCTVDKAGVNTTRCPKNQADFDKDPKNYTGGFKYNP